jgi:hypothetical protein
MEPLEQSVPDTSLSPVLLGFLFKLASTKLPEDDLGPETIEKLRQIIPDFDSDEKECNPFIQHRVIREIRRFLAALEADRYSASI